jgi:hypothetical protein
LVAAGKIGHKIALIGQRVFGRLKTLIDCLLTYIVKSLTELRSWAERPFFKDERALAEQRDSLRVSLAEADAKLSTFEHAKSMLFQHEYSLESSVPRFLKNSLGLSVEREETYKEDFWVLDGENKKVAIAEVKSLVKGFRRGAIYSVLHHRDEYGLDDTFPALLVANCNLQAGSFEDKDRVIDINDCQFAAESNVLIIRIEDLVRLWDRMRTKKITPEQILPLIVGTKGWLHVNSDLDFAVIPKP